jgi:hypothetical protein
MAIQQMLDDAAQRQREEMEKLLKTSEEKKEDIKDPVKTDDEE